jgi:hypothetical protein
MGRLEEAVAYSEAALKHNPETHTFAIPLVAAQALLGREKDARTTRDSYPWWEPNLQSIMYSLPFKAPEVADRMADGLIKAGVPGQPMGYRKYYRVSPEYRLQAEEIRALVLDRTTVGFHWWTGEEWRVDYADGRVSRRGFGGSDDGRCWIEGDVLCQQWRGLYEGLKDCAAVFRNPDGTSEMRNEYFSLSDIGLHPFSVED